MHHSHFTFSFMSEQVIFSWKHYLHDSSLDLFCGVIHVERELGPDSTGVLNQSHSGAMRRDVQRVHHLEYGDRNS